MRQEFQIMYKKVLEFSQTVVRGASQRSQTEETLSMVDKGKYPKRFAEVSIINSNVQFHAYWYEFGVFGNTKKSSVKNVLIHHMHQYNYIHLLCKIY